MLALLILKEVSIIVFYLSLPCILIYLAYKERKQQRENFNLAKEVSEILLEKADDEKPIMLNVSQKKLIEKTVMEIKKRKLL